MARSRFVPHTQRERVEGRESLQTAATLEPQRAVLRSYLGKAFSNTKDYRLAERELARAKEMDANDPTAWLYSALLDQQESRINEAVRELEHSQDLNNNRSVFRSQAIARSGSRRPQREPGCHLQR